MSRERRQVSQDAALAKQLAEQYQAEDAAPMFEAVLPTGGPTPKRARGKGKAGSSATPAPPSATAARAALRPFARKLDRTEKQLALTLPDEHLLVNSHSFRTLTWGKDGHREVLRANAPNLVELVGGASVDAVYLPLESDQLSGLRDEWDALPHVVPQVPPDAGYVYVTRESAEKIGVGGELYHRIFIEEGTRPKQISEGAYAAAEEARKEKERAGRGDRKLWGETAPLGLKLQVVKTQRNGDCFFDALCKAYVQVAQAARNREVEQLGGPSDGAAAGASATEAVYRCPAMWAAAFPEEAAASGGAPPPPSVPLTVKELRQVVACHFPEEAWIIGQAVGGDSFAFIVEHDLELTKANVAALADDAADKAYWADESAIAVLQRYLSARLLIFNPAAGDGYRCACSADIQERGPHGLSYIMLRHSHRASKLQHYELYVLPGSRRAVFDEASLAAGVKRAFARVCPDATPAWASAADAEPGAEEEPIVLA